MTKNGFLRIERQYWRSATVEGLSPASKLILIELHYNFNGNNNGEISLPQRAIVERYRWSYSTVKRAFRELHEAGLIETTASGSFNHKVGARKGLASKYRLLHVAERAK